MTPQEEAQWAEYREKWIKGVGYCTDPIDPVEAVAAVRDFVQEFVPGEYHYGVYAGPDEAVEKSREWFRDNGYVLDGASLNWRLFYEGQLAHWVPKYLKPSGLGVDEDPKRQKFLELADAVARNCFIFWIFTGHVAICERPSIFSVDERERLHAEDGPALRFRDGSEYYFYHGVQVPEHVITEPEKLTAETAFAEENTEVRRVMIERMGWEKLLGRAKKLQEDKAGALWRIELGGDEEPIQFLELTDATQLPDGTYRMYYECVPPEITTAQEGVAWQWGLTAEEYAPYVET